MFTGLKILLLILTMADPLPKTELKLKKELGKDWVRPRQVMMVRSPQEAALQVLQLQATGVKWDSKLMLLDMGASSLNEVQVPEIKFVLPEK